MRALWIALLLPLGITLGKASQVPLVSYGYDSGSLISENDHSHLWRLHEAPSENSTSHLIFDTINSLLQHWPNTRYRNGHTIVPATIPAGTILYHGTHFDRIPINPEWVATDAEHARLFCVGEGTGVSNRGCWQLTITVQSPLKILYFDGSSSVKLTDGPTDTQDVLLWGRSRPEMLFADNNRICGLCDWGRKYGIHGFMRMQTGFEIMLCDFHKDVEVVSFINLATELVSPPSTVPNPSNISMCDTIQDPPVMPPPIPINVPSYVFTAMRFGAVEVGTWHNYFPGDVHARLDLSRAISLYDTNLFPSLVSRRYRKERWDHRVDGLSAKDVQTLRNRLDDIVAEDRWEAPASGVDWSAQFHVITNRYAERLEVFRYMVTNITDTQRAAGLAFDHLRKMLSPYRLHSAVPDSSSTRSSNHSWAVPVFKWCATTHTNHLSKLPSLTPSEKTLLYALEGVNKEICRVLVKSWAEGVELGLIPWKEPVRPEGDLRKLLDGWMFEVDLLMKWLDWSLWARCPETCGPEEMCYMPTWPFFNGVSPVPTFQPEGYVHARYEQPSNPRSWPWHKPQPRCVRKFPPHDDIYT